MGGFMTYQRMRNRNNISLRIPTWFYPRPDIDQPHPINWGALVGDLNRMEADYLDPERFADDPRVLQLNSPLHQVAAATGVDVETVRKILRYVFLEQQ